MTACEKIMTKLGDIAQPINVRASARCSFPVYAVTKHDGMVPSAEYFKKQVHSRDVEGYKVVSRGQFAYATIHLDEGSIGLLKAAEQCIISPMYTVFQVDESRVYAPYLLRVLKSSWALSQYATMGNGSVHRRRAISFEALARLTVALPSVDEQLRIAFILDKIDNLRHKRQNAIHLFDEFLRLAFIDMFGDPSWGEQRWPTALVGDLVDTIESGWSAPSTDSILSDGGLGVLKVSAVSTGWFLREEAKAIESSVVDRQLIMPKRGDLLFSRANTRELVGACCLVEEDVHDRFLPDKLWRINAKNEMATNEYLCFLFRNRSFRRDLTKQATGSSASMLNISQSKLLNTSAPRPPIELQKNFSSIVNKIFLARKKAADSHAEIDSLPSSLMSQFFS